MKTLIIIKDTIEVNLSVNGLPPNKKINVVLNDKTLHSFLTNSLGEYAISVAWASIPAPLRKQIKFIQELGVNYPIPTSGRLCFIGASDGITSSNISMEYS